MVTYCIEMIDYNISRQWVLEEARFPYLGGTYCGPGLLEWIPDEGFRLNVFAKRTGPPLPSKIAFGISGQLKQEDFGTIEMKIQMSGLRALARRVPLVDLMNVVTQGHLSMDLPNILFYSRSGRPSHAKGITGDCLYYGVPSRPIFPDVVENSRKIAGEEAGTGWSRSAIAFNDELLTVRGEKTEDSYLKLRWSASGRNWTAKFCWEWMESFGEAFAILSGSTIQPVLRGEDNGKWQRIEVTKKIESTHLGFIKLLSMDFIDKPLLFNIARFLSQEDLKATTCKYILYQVAEAARQRTLQARELLLATILEAALRTLYNKPFIVGVRNAGEVEPLMKRFREDYGSREWKEACNKALATWRRLRHRNAHPDWLFSEKWTDDKFADSHRDMIFLSNFYGQMILALSGQQTNIEGLIKQKQR